MAASPHADRCSNDADCLLNEVCTPSSTCDCDVSWDGVACSSLLLDPVIKNSGLQSNDNGLPTSSWDGSVHAIPSSKAGGSDGVGGGGGGCGMIAAQVVSKLLQLAVPHHCNIINIVLRRASLQFTRCS